MANILHGASTGTYAGDYPQGHEQAAELPVIAAPPAPAPIVRIAVTVHLESVPQFKYRVNVKTEETNWNDFIVVVCRKLAINEKHHVECIVDSSGAFITEISDLIEGDVLAVRLNPDLKPGMKSVGVIRPDRAAVRKAMSPTVAVLDSARRAGGDDSDLPNRAVVEGFIYTRDARPPAEEALVVRRDPHEPVYPEVEEEANGAADASNGNALVPASSDSADNSELEWVGPPASASWDRVPDMQQTAALARPFPAPNATEPSHNRSSVGPSHPSTARRTRPQSANARRRSEKAEEVREVQPYYDGPRSTTGSWGKGSAKHQKQQQRPKSARPRTGRKRLPQTPGPAEEGEDLQIVSSQVTCDELQNIIANAIQRWGKRESIDADIVMSACHRAIASLETAPGLGEAGVEISLSLGSPRDTESTSEVSMSKLQFTRGVRECLRLDVPWPNTDYLWTKMLKIYDRERPADVNRRQVLNEIVGDKNEEKNSNVENLGGVLFDEIAVQPQRRDAASKQSRRRSRSRGAGGEDKDGQADGAHHAPKKMPTSQLTSYQFEQAFASPAGAAAAAAAVENTTNLTANESSSRGGRNMDVEFGRVMDAMDADNLLLHEAFAVFDCNGDGRVSCGEFLRVLKRMKPSLNISKPTMFNMFLAMCNDPDTDRYISPTKFVDFFTSLYLKRLKLLRDMLWKVSEDQETMQGLIDQEVVRETRQGLVSQKRRLGELLHQVKAMTRRVSFTVQAGREYVRHNRLGGEAVTDPAEDAPLDDKGETTGRISAINELLSARIKKRTAILPLKRQILGETYGLSGDAMQQTVETATWQLKMELNELDAMRLDEEGAIQSLDT